jgi:hypothetical protein
MIPLMAPLAPIEREGGLKQIDKVARDPAPEKQLDHAPRTGVRLELGDSLDVPPQGSLEES